jgi:hypothetical protein
LNYTMGNRQRLRELALEGMTDLEQIRTGELREAQNRALQLFHEVQARGLIRPGITEGQLNNEIYALAQKMLGTTTYWHKRIVRSGRNTLLHYDENPPGLTIKETTFCSWISALYLRSGRQISDGRLYLVPIP